MALDAMLEQTEPPVDSSVADFITTFPTTQATLSDAALSVGTQQGGVGAGGPAVTGGTPGYAYAGATEAIDYFAFVQGRFNPNKHFAEVTIRRPAGYSPGVAHEVEVHVGGSVSATYARSYEFDFYVTGELQAIRWDDPLGGFNVSDVVPIDGVWATVPLADDEVVRVTFEIVSGNPVMKVYRNGVYQVTYTDTSAGKYTSGSPGWAHFFRTGATQSSYGIKQFRAGSLP